MFVRLFALALAVFAMGQVSAAVAQVEVTLAEEKARRVIPDVDRIDVSGIPGKFSGIRVYALDGTAVDIRKIDVHYSDGTTFTEDRGRTIRLDTKDIRTRLMGPNNGRGPEKFIDKIVMHYKAAPGESAQARVRIVGVTSTSGARATRNEGQGSGSTIVKVAPGDKAASGNIPVSPAGPARAGGDVLFGVQYVGFGVDRDVIKIGSEFGKFDKIRLRVLDNDIFIQEMRVIYGNGTPDVLAVAANVPANTRTKWFTLKGDRFIKEVQLVYKSRPGFSGQARVEVFGEFAEGWYGGKPVNVSGGRITQSGEAFSHKGNRGWLYLGGQQPKFFSLSLKRGIGYETDVISVARNWGFNRMRLDVKDRAIQLSRITVVYSDGTDETIKVARKIDGGTSYGPVPLQAKAISEVKVRYRSRVFDSNASGKGHAFVEFWAQ